MPNTIIPDGDPVGKEKGKGSDTPYGYCQCGCGGKTKLSQYTLSSKGWVKDEPRRFINGHHNRIKGKGYKIEDRGHETPCWIWQYHKNSDGYAKRKVNGSMKLVHRALYEEKYGETPNNLELDHLCRVRACVNPDHLEPVSHKENCERGIYAKKLDAQQVAEIRRLCEEEGVSQRKVAAQFGLAQPTISKIIRRETWPKSSRHIRCTEEFLELLESDFGIDRYYLYGAFMGIPPAPKKQAIKVCAWAVKSSKGDVEEAGKAVRAWARKRGVGTYSRILIEAPPLEWEGVA